jgi:polyribonucleotide nucleotidyltransferase
VAAGHKTRAMAWAGGAGFRGRTSTAIMAVSTHVRTMPMVHGVCTITRYGNQIIRYGKLGENKHGKKEQKAHYIANYFNFIYSMQWQWCTKCTPDVLRM